MAETELPPPDFGHLEESIRFRVMIEISHNMGLMSDHVYYTRYASNAEILDRDYAIWLELKSIEEDS